MAMCSRLVLLDILSKKNGIIGVYGYSLLHYEYLINSLASTIFFRVTHMLEILQLKLFNRQARVIATGDLAAVKIVKVEPGKPFILRL